jgi:hypothetical protein
MQADPSPTSELPIPQVRVRQHFKNKQILEFHKENSQKLNHPKKYKRGQKPIEK